MNLVADTKINQAVSGIYLTDIKIAGKKYSLNVSAHEKKPDWDRTEDQLNLHFYCEDGTEFWMIFRDDIHINRDRNPMTNERADREAFLSVDGQPHKWIRWAECIGDPNDSEKGIEFALSKEEKK